MPVHPIEPLSSDDLPRVRLYCQLALGEVLEVFALAERQFRHGVVCERKLLVPSCPALEEPMPTMLGEAQKQWFRLTRQASQAQWKCLLDAVMMRLTVTNPLESAAECLPLAILRSPVAIDQDVYINLDVRAGYPTQPSAFLTTWAPRQIQHTFGPTSDVEFCISSTIYRTRP
jgi:phosphodiesterase/alkaline phosphatase D-like protein